jgi:peptidoglycan DL-endopeptidase RipA
MSEGEELLASGEGVSWRPGFELALRGYDKRQVDQFVSRVDGEMSSLVAERERAFGQVRDLSARLEQVQAELVELRQRPVQVERASFRDLGPTVDQILALAEQQAKTITDDGGRWAAEQRAEAERVLAEARQRADRLRADSEAVCERAELEARRVDEQSARQVEQARAEAEGLVQEARAQAREQVEAAREQTEQEVQARQQALAGLQAELDTAQQQLGQSRQEGAVVEREVAGLQQRLDEVGQQLAAELDRLDEARRAADSAERHATQVRARVQREAERVAQLAAAAVMAAAARGAETGEYPMVVPVRSGTNDVADQGIEPPAGIIAPDPAAATDNRGHTSHDTDHAVPTQREPQPEELARHTE